MNSGAHNERISATRADRFGVCVLLRADFDYSIYCHAVPSLRNDFAHFGVDRAESYVQQEVGRAFTRRFD